MEIKKDKSNMKKVILDFPQQFSIGLKAAKNVKATGRFDAVLICGMGGSALAGDILNIWLSAYKIALPLYLHRDYGLPHQADEKYLVICNSYSGNTEETLSAFEQARKKKLKIVVISSGGELIRLAQKYQIPFAQIPSGFQPRMTLGFQLAALMEILVNSGIIKNNLQDILALENSLKPKTLEAQGQTIAKNLKGKIPVVYASNRFKALARLWKIKFNENTKIPAFSNHFPELNHNEMIGFSETSKSQIPHSQFSVIILKDAADHPRIQKRMELTAEVLKKKDVTVDIININGKDILSKIFSNILLGDWISYYLALEYGTDPTLVKMNEQFKKKLAARYD